MSFRIYRPAGLAAAHPDASRASCEHDLGRLPPFPDRTGVVVARTHTPHLTQFADLAGRARSPSPARRSRNLLPQRPSTPPLIASLPLARAP
eukprot:365688-Chlamydomonas_euryale.AAC.8